VGFKQKLMQTLADPDKLKNLADKAQQAVSDNQDQLNGAIGKASAVVSQKTGGKYDDKINKVSDAATDAIEKVKTAGNEEPADPQKEQTAPKTGEEQDPPAAEKSVPEAE
jgi:ABC-type transporter Mla subunit MlaD